MSSLTLLTAFLAQLTGVGIELGGEYLNERIYQSSRPWVALEGAGLQLVLGPRFNVDLRTGELREKDWDQPGDYGLIVHQLKWGAPDVLNLLGLPAPPGLILATGVVYGGDPDGWAGLVDSMATGAPMRSSIVLMYLIA